MFMMLAWFLVLIPEIRRDVRRAFERNREDEK